MLEFLAKRSIASFGRRWNYDTSYMNDILEGAGIDALLPLHALGNVSKYRRDIPPNVYYAAKITASIAADCGPCAQLCVSMAEAEGLDEATLRALVSGDAEALGADERLGYDFARAVLAREDARADRETIARRFGMRGLVSLAYALVASQAFPAFKYATGYASACARLHVGTGDVDVCERALV